MHKPSSALKCCYDNSLFIVDSVRYLSGSLEARGVVLNEDEKIFLNEALESLADLQEAVEAVLPKEQL